MDDTSFTIIQLLLIISIITGVVAWLLRSLLCKALQNPDDKVVLVTGCDTGIGHELARHLESLGFTVFACCLDTSSEGAQRLRVAAGPRLTLVNMDVRSEEHVRHAIHFVRENMPKGEEGLYALINNAGVCVCGEFDWQTMGQIANQVDVNLLGPMRVIKQCLPLLRSGNGRIINVSSVAGLQGYPGLSAYCATKFGLEGFTKVLRSELEKFGIPVVSVQPGDFSKATKLLDNHHFNMNVMWGEMSEENRRQYQDYFVAYHDTVAKLGITGQRRKPLPSLPKSLLVGFEKAILSLQPEKSYLLLPTWTSEIKMLLLNMLPSKLAQRIVSDRYKKTVPKIQMRQNL